MDHKNVKHSARICTAAPAPGSCTTEQQMTASFSLVLLMICAPIVMKLDILESHLTILATLSFQATMDAT